MSERGKMLAKLAIAMTKGEVDHPKISPVMTDDSEPQPSTSAAACNEDKSYFTVTRTSETRMNLRKVSQKTFNETTDSENEDFSADESVYSPSEGQGSESDRGSSNISINDTTDQQPEDSVANLPLRKGKKRSSNPNSWKQNVAKKLRNSGQSYVSKRGKFVKEKVMGPPCPNRCKLACSTKFDENLRTELFKNYWSLASFQRQRDFLNSCIEPVQLKYRRISLSKETPRNQNCAFFLLNNGNKVRVCKRFLTSTFAISERVVRTIIQSKASCGAINKEDKRGKHSNHPKTDSEILDSIRAHINSIPRIESHYLRAQTSREYIDGGLSIAEMYRHYKTDRTSLQKNVPSYDTYARIFNTEFNIGFFVPKKDQCDICEAFKNAIGEEKEQLESSYKLHQEEKKLSREEKTKDKENTSDIVVATYDLQAVLPVPIGQTSAFFYKSRLNCYNLTISEMKNDHTVCYFWHEALGNRGSNEIGSCVLMFLQELSVTRPGADVVFYTDNCGGQQKNRFIIGMYLYAVENLAIKSITHKFLIRGHTQNEGDAVHSVIEKSLKKAKKSGPIYVPDQYVSIIRTAKKRGNAFIVKELNYKDFFDLKLLSEEICLNNSKNINGDPIKISEMKLLRFEKGSNVYSYKTSYKDITWEQVLFKAVNRRTSAATELQSIQLKPAYSSKIPLAPRKKADMLSLLKSNIIPSYYEPFFNNIF